LLISKKDTKKGVKDVVFLLLFNPFYLNFWGTFSVPSSGAVPLPSFFGIRGLAQRRESTFFPVSKTFSTKRFPRNTERVIGGESG
jgi:hypothetical protein